MRWWRSGSRSRSRWAGSGGGGWPGAPRRDQRSRSRSAFTSTFTTRGLLFRAPLARGDVLHRLLAGGLAERLEQLHVALDERADVRLELQPLPLQLVDVVHDPDEPG